MRPATDRVANPKMRTAAFRPPFNLRRACWRSFPEPQEDVGPQALSRPRAPIPKEEKRRCRRSRDRRQAAKASFLSSARAVSLGGPHPFEGKTEEAAPDAGRSLRTPLAAVVGRLV